MSIAINLSLDRYRFFPLFLRTRYNCTSTDMCSLFVQVFFQLQTFLLFFITPTGISSFVTVFYRRHVFLPSPTMASFLLLFLPFIDGISSISVFPSLSLFPFQWKNVNMVEGEVIVAMVSEMQIGMVIKLNMLMVPNL